MLEREAQSNRQIYEALLQRQNELQIVSNSGGNNVRLMDRAVVPGAPFTPDTRRNFMLGALAGVLLAVGLVLALDYLDDTVKTPEDITRRLKLPFLGLFRLKGNDIRYSPGGFATIRELSRVRTPWSSQRREARVIGPQRGNRRRQNDDGALAIVLAYVGPVALD